jgi:oligopeptide/dipeptide ABC transporter ATP-binding protein
MNQEKLLEVRNLKKHFPIKGGLLRRTIGHVKAVEDISFTMEYGETLGIVGESGSGKSTLGRTIIRLLDPTDGQIIFQGKDISNLSRKQMRPHRKDIQMVFQDPYASLNPRMTIGQLVEEPLLIHTDLSKKDRLDKVRELLNIVGLNDEAINRYPHEFSGGQRQRIGIARALVVRPKLIIADEPVSALDVSIQSQVINLMMDLQRDFHLSYLFIAHDLSVVKHISDRIGVMYLGKMVEIAPKKELFSSPLHPYTQALLSAVPVPDPKAKRERIILKGDIPSAANPPSGCVFHTRCPKAFDQCSAVKPELKEVAPKHFVACHLYTN